MKSVAIRLWERSPDFSGSRRHCDSFTVAVLVWALAYFPRPESISAEFDTLRSEAAESLAGETLELGSSERTSERLSERLSELDNLEAATFLEQSALGRIGKAVAPVFRPLGWDWRVSAAVLASFPAREVVLAVLGTIYAVGSDVEADDPSLIANIRGATHPDGTPVFSTAMALGVMVFFAFCLQCGATVAAIRRETNSWGLANLRMGLHDGSRVRRGLGHLRCGRLDLGGRMILSEVLALLAVLAVVLWTVWRQFRPARGSKGGGCFGCSTASGCPVAPRHSSSGRPTPSP